MPTATKSRPRAAKPVRTAAKTPTLSRLALAWLSAVRDARQAAKDRDASPSPATYAREDVAIGVLVAARDGLIDAALAQTRLPCAVATGACLVVIGPDECDALEPDRRVSRQDIRVVAVPREAIAWA